MSKAIMLSGLNRANMEDFIDVILPPKNELSFVINSGNNKSFQIPTAISKNGSYPQYNWDISWGDGVIETKAGQGVNYESSILHNYPEINTEYEIKITPHDPTEAGWLRAFGGIIRNESPKIIKITSGELTEQAIMLAPNEDSICSNMFSSAANLIDIGKFNLPQQITSVGHDFCEAMFSYCQKLTKLNDFQLPPNIETIGEGFASTMFENCNALTDLNNFNLPQKITHAPVTFCYNMFHLNVSLATLNNFKLPRALTSVDNAFCIGMFYNNLQLKSIKSFFNNVNLSQAYLNKLNVFKNTFQNCTACTEDFSDVIQLQTSPTATNACFAGCTGVTGVPTNWK